MKRFGVAAAGILAVAGLVMFGVSNGAGANSTKPTVSKVVPEHGPVDGGTLVTITGTNLLGATGVMFGTTPASTIVNRSNSTLQVISPSESAGPPVDIEVTTGVGTSTASSNDQFSYVTTPTIQSLRPRLGSTLGKNLVAISGADFDAPCSVSFGTNPALNATVLTSNVIAAESPPGAAGTVQVSVACSNGSTPQDTAADYTYVLRVPVVTSVVFDVGNPLGGETVDIYGLRFMPGAQVNFGTTPATNVTYHSTSWLSTTAPAGSGQVDVNVVTTKGGSQINPQDVYLYSNTAP